MSQPQPIKIHTQEFIINEFAERNQILICKGCNRKFNPKTLDEAVAIASRHEEKYHSEVLDEG